MFKLEKMFSGRSMVNFSLLIFIALCRKTYATYSTKNCTHENNITLKCNYIPSDIPSGTYLVRVVDFKKYNEIFIVNSSNFQSVNWAKLKSLEIAYDGNESIISIIFKSDCFKGLRNLLELHIHLVPIFTLENQVFNGLDSLKLLDLSGCVRMNIKGLVPSLQGKLPRLESLNLTLLHTFRDGVIINTDFAQALMNKNVSSLEISYIRIGELNATALATFVKTLRNINVSFSSISELVMDKNATVNRFDRLNVLDFSHSSDICRIGMPSKIVNQSWKSSQLKENKWYSVLAPRVVNISACVRYPASIWIGNSTLNINSFINVTSEKIIGRENSLKHLDLRINCNKYLAGTIRHVDIAGNGLDFLHPSLLSCVPNLAFLDMSSNKLHQMQSTHIELFQQLLTTVRHLRVIKMSSNFLKFMPHNMFINNSELEEIDLSHNELDQVYFALNHLENLNVLNLRDNKIKVLSEISMHNIDSINSIKPNLRKRKTTVNLESNPLSCSKCEAKEFLQWLTSAKTANLLTPNLTCVGEKGLIKIVNEQVLQIVKDICKTRMIIIISTISGAALAVIVILIVTITYKYRKRVTKIARRRALLQNIKEGRDEFEFVLFLSHSSDDKAFVEKYVVRQLNENLQLMTGIDRNLVCTGDDFLRPGFRILDEITNCIDRASAFIVILSDSFSESMYCHHEVDMAFRLNKPIVLMIKGQVDEELMKPLMKTLFKSTVRVLWTIQNDEFVMNISWENVCKSVLDLMAENIN